jgi:hypothetical protein
LFISPTAQLSACEVAEHFLGLDRVAERVRGAEVLAVLVEPERLVWQAADARVKAGVAEVLLAGGTVTALAADRNV